MSNTTGKITKQDVTGKKEDIMILQCLDGLHKRYSDCGIRETVYLEDFAALKTTDQNINPKYIIRDTLITYLRSVCDIYKQPLLLQTYIFSFFKNNVTHVHKYCNNMLFSEDITTLCFLYHVSLLNSYQCETVQILMSLMKNKYGIDTEENVRENNTKSTQKQNRITLFNIAFSYPSIFYDMSINSYTNITLYDQFSDFKLPKRIFLPCIVFILPGLNQPPPLAVLLLIKLKIMEHSVHDIKNVEILRATFNDIYHSFKYSIFPQRLKLELCEKWGIIEKERNKYKYFARFREYRLRAKFVIASMMPNDRNVRSILYQL